VCDRLYPPAGVRQAVIVWNRKSVAGETPIMIGNQFRAIGLMSGTSMDGIDAAFLETDGSTRLTVATLLGSIGGRSQYR
jgi:hypothetical protein